MLRISSDNLENDKKLSEETYPDALPPISLLQAMLPPLLFIALAIAFFVLNNALSLPSGEQLIEISKNAFSQYGYWIVLVAAFLEAALVLNLYVPGSAVVILGVASSRTGPLNPVGVITCALLGFILAYVFDFFLGRFGWHVFLVRAGFKVHLDRAKNKARSGFGPWFYAWFVHPNLAAFAATAFGAIQSPLIPFLWRATLATTLWTSAWGVLAYISSDLVFALTDARILMPVALLWLVVTYIRFLKSTNSNRTHTT